MATSATLCTLSTILWLLLLFPFIAQSDNTTFLFNRFNRTESNFSLDGAIVMSNGALRLTDKSKSVTGHAFYEKPMSMFNISASSQSSSFTSFYTYFVFAIVPPSSSNGGYGLAFVLSPSKNMASAEAAHYLGLTNSSNDGNKTNHIFAVEFDTVRGFNEDSEGNGNHVGININSVDSVDRKIAVFYNKNNNNREEEMVLNSGELIQAWIEYDGVAKLVNVTIAPANQSKPTKPLLSLALNLTDYLLETMYVGFSASTGDKTSSHYILGWSFSTNRQAPQLNFSQLPSPPKDKDSSRFDRKVIAVIAAFCALAAVLLGILAYFLLNRWRNLAEDMEEWELDCPHRFKYKDLYIATKGFKESEIIGVGGFASVYKGLLSTSGLQIAVKKITRDSNQGLRQFAAEIESLGRLRHKNLVHFQGWCKKKKDLLLVYDYIPNGSLASLLYHPRPGFVLKWVERFNIIKGVAAGLLYLHEEWDQVVIHRDIKSCNVLIDADMNPRLGDFGLARLYDHGTMSHTTNVVGTIGYIAPELARSGKASAYSDVFAYGVLLLEVVTGKRPVGSNNFCLLDWVMELHQEGKILDAVDPKLKDSFEFVVEELQLVLGLGLISSHTRPEMRPTMRQVVRYLNGDEPLPVVDDWGPSSGSRQFSDFINSRHFNSGVLFTSDMLTKSTSTGTISTRSLEAGR